MHDHDRSPERPSIDPEVHVDEASVRHELSRVFDVCASCRRCTDSCVAFPTLFDLVDGLPGPDAGLLTPHEQDRVVAGCHLCGLCAVGCPHADSVDVPRTMERVRAMWHATGRRPWSDRVADRLLNPASPAARLIPTTPMRPADAGPVRRAWSAVVSLATGLSPVAVAPPRIGVRFSTWFRDRERPVRTSTNRTVLMFPTCVVEHHDPAVGRDTVAVCEHHGVDVDVSAAGCCGAPWLYAGDLDRFRSVAGATVRVLAAELRSGTGPGPDALIVPEPTCSHVLRQRCAEHVAPDAVADAEFVASRTLDAAGYLAGLHRSAGPGTALPGPVPDRIVHHEPCRMQVQGVGSPGADLLGLLGVPVEVVRSCSGAGDAWWRRRGNDEAAAVHLGATVTAINAAAGAAAVTGHCSSANAAIGARTGSIPEHPIRVFARACGLDDTTT